MFLFESNNIFLLDQTVYYFGPNNKITWKANQLKIVFTESKIDLLGPRQRINLSEFSKIHWILKETALSPCSTFPLRFHRITWCKNHKLIIPSCLSTLDAIYRYTMRSFSRITKRIFSSIMVDCGNSNRWSMSWHGEAQKDLFPRLFDRLYTIMRQSRKHTHTHKRYKIGSPWTKKRQRYYCFVGNSRNHLALNSSRKLTFLNSDWCRKLPAKSELWSLRGNKKDSLCPRAFIIIKEKKKYCAYYLEKNTTSREGRRDRRLFPRRVSQKFALEAIKDSAGTKSKIKVDFTLTEFSFKVQLLTYTLES